MIQFRFRGFADSILECKACDAKTTVHPECLPIPVPKGDPFYPETNRTTGEPFCLPFTRHVSATNPSNNSEKLFPEPVLVCCVPLW